MIKVTSVVAVAALLASSYAMADNRFQEEKWVRVENRRDMFPIFFVYITPAGQSTWGSDQLGGSVIGAGSSHTWNVSWDGCRVDLKAVTFTGMSVEQRNIDVCGGQVWTLHD